VSLLSNFNTEIFDIHLEIMIQGKISAAINKENQLKAIHHFVVDWNKPERHMEKLVLLIVNAYSTDIAYAHF